MTIYNSNGQSVYSKEDQLKDNPKIDIDVSAYPRGIYIVEFLMIGGNRSVQKIVK
jgi:uncharacterized membrane protein